jgi:hypothetical protein
MGYLLSRFCSGAKKFHYGRAAIAELYVKVYEFYIGERHMQISSYTGGAPSQAVGAWHFPTAISDPHPFGKCLWGTPRQFAV